MLPPANLNPHNSYLSPATARSPRRRWLEIYTCWLTGSFFTARSLNKPLAGWLAMLLFYKANRSLDLHPVAHSVIRRPRPLIDTQNHPALRDSAAGSGQTRTHQTIGMKNQILATITGEEKEEIEDQVIMMVILTLFAVNLLTLVYGISVGWAAPNIVLFQTPQSPVGQLGTDQISLIASLLCAGGVLGTFFYGWISDIWGRKIVLFFAAVPQMIGLLLLAIGDHCYYIYASRVLLGFGGGGVSILVPVFIAEISSEK